MRPERYQQVKALFLQAVELDDGPRVQFLSDACRDDPQLRQEVESLLSHHNPMTILPGAPEALPRPRLRSQAHHPVLRVRKLGTKGQLALGAALCAILLGLFGWWQRNHVLGELHNLLGKRLNAIIEAHVHSFLHLARVERGIVESWVRNPELRSPIQHLVKIADQRADDYVDQLRTSPAQSAIRTAIQSFGGSNTEYTIWSKDQEIIAETAVDGSALGTLASPSITDEFAQVIRGKTLMFVGDTAEIFRDDNLGRNGVKDIFVAAPVYGDDDRVIAVAVFFNTEVAVLMEMVSSFGKITDTSETYAFNKEGLMLSASRFVDELKSCGILSETATGAALEVTLHDPGGDLTAGYQPTTSRSSCPLTLMARHAIAGENGENLTGYRNYLGRTVVGVWRWLPGFKCGFAMEMSRDEAYRAVKFVERQLEFSFLLLVVAAFGVLISFYWIGRLRRQIGTDHQLGQYRLGKLLGEGGMGQVYLGFHALLRRPCAIKLLKPELMNRQSLARFEREVQLASTLSHPNTIQIYDYGTTPEGIFYYVMEYLSGLDLEQLVATAGPIPWARTVFILEQVCASLREAHQLGMVHRDIKPQNIMLCNLGGQSDFVKVVDFGLAKDIDESNMTVTAAGLLAGTPHYMAPERWRDASSVNASSDIFAFGAVAYRLLTADDAFEGGSAAAIMDNVLHSNPPRPSARVTAAIPDALDQIVMDCLAKNVESRPNVEDLLTRLKQLHAGRFWDHHQANQWWSDRAHELAQP